MLAIVVCGEIASGKSTVSRYIAEITRYNLLSFGALVRSECNKSCILPTRASCQQVGYELFQRLGAAGIVNALLQTEGTHATGGVIIDGVRHSTVLSEIRRLFSPVFVVAVAAQLEDRYHRYKTRNRGELLSIEEFVAISNHPIELGISDLFREADVVIDSGVSEEEMLRTVRTALETERMLPR